MIDKRKIQHAFGKAALTYDNAAQLQRMVGEWLLATQAPSIQTNTLLDLGCGTGFLTQRLIRNFPNSHITALDIAFPMLEETQKKLSNSVHYICADAEHLPFTSSCLDGIFSNLALQWCEDLSQTFAEFKRVLKPDGVLQFSTFGENTLYELKTAWQTVDDFSHVNAFYNENDLLHFLKIVGFERVEYETLTIVSRYDSVLCLMRELKQLGANYVHQSKNQMTSKKQLKMMMKAYEIYRVYAQIPATFELIKITAHI